MGDVINLRTERKRAKRKQAETEAAERRISHGQNKVERELAKARAEKESRTLDQHRIDRGAD